MKKMNFDEMHEVNAGAKYLYCKHRGKGCTSKWKYSWWTKWAAEKSKKSHEKLCIFRCY